ncbi:transcriptional regulatory protein [[Clostridium] sordellii]|uniref:PucR C-terminal helix-turn-helix domain protein n=5 Tax=Paraclostridium sordellii TaxID=1505 RepID=A0ABM9RQ96_PARSO|nr:PucR family transcriptional regulator [Paeniclostridium sordellii]TAN65737.1 PucR family transcriptional regulator [Paeniclostridium sordellii 8483]CEJ73976.1 pucR C-terminal helix-turn-helix domain protein [[Clostridium] sordellii] [Paeniclostridium sordellii]CEK29664.1 transcriptional regulatory protein [[Clostridium] sordellii] [Paeniclostridium sordellii]CEN69521.1 transcriptional regulatory protein [[Clostridium] sordellii] [Paeniclostridium sordellii]CEN72789.1 transcriptional regulat
MISCKDLLTLNAFKYIKLVAGEGGIYKSVTWTYICETLDFSKWINGGELIFITGMGMDLGENSLTDLIKDCANQNVAGLVILTNSEYINEIPKDCVDIANKVNLPLFNMSWDIKLIDVTKEISNYIIEKSFINNKEKELLKELLFNSSLSKERVYKLLKHCNFKFKELSLVAVFNVLNVHIYNLDYVANYIKLKLSKVEASFILEIFENNVLCIVSIDQPNKQKIKETLKSINEYLNESIFSILSIGRNYKDIFSLKKSYEEALNLISFYNYEDMKLKYIDYENMGFYKLLFDFNDIDKLSLYKEDILGKLIDYDKRKSTSFMNTLKVYIFNNSNLLSTSKKLFIHRNTLIYRINKIKTILEKDIDDPIIKNELMNAIMINNYLNYLKS